MFSKAVNWRILFLPTILTDTFMFAVAATAQQVDDQVEPVQDVLAAQDLQPSEIVIPRSAHFSAPDGSDVVVPAGIYVVELASESQLRLVPRDGEPIVVAAEQTEHEEQLDDLLALGEETEDDEFHVVLLLSGGIAHDAAASYSGVVVRGIGRRRLSTTQNRRARARYKPLPTVPTQMLPPK